MDNKTTSELNPRKGHSQTTLDILDNAVAAGKFTQDQVDNLLSISSTDANVIKAMKGVVKEAPIKPELIAGKYHPTLIEQAATKSYDDIEKTVKGGFNDLKRSAPDLYKAKFFEKHGRLPAVV